MKRTRYACAAVLMLPFTVAPAQQDQAQAQVTVDCVDKIQDQSGSCLLANSNPTLGMLNPYPGLDNVVASSAFAGGGVNNRATAPRATVAGGGSNTASASHATVGGGNANLASGPGSTIAGGSNNLITGFFSTIGGGTYNQASRDGSTVSGGTRNFIFGYGSTVGGGALNDISGFYSDYATVGGGYYNQILAPGATIAGGYRNTASASNSAIGGGRFNSTGGYESTVPGGLQNAATGNFSFAAGRKAKANHAGTFVWGDSQSVDKKSSLADQFSVFCSGGARFFTNPDQTSGVLLAPGSGSWSAVSDRNSKENFESIDGRSILERVIALPLSSWNYKAQDDAVRHMGPMAQDFHAAFGLGVSDELIDTIDPDGVALAAIQGLHDLVLEKDAEIAELRTRQTALEAKLAEVIGRLDGQAPAARSR